MKFVYSNGKSGNQLEETFKEYNDYKITCKSVENGNNVTINCLEKDDKFIIWCKDDKALDVLIHYIEVASNNICYLSTLLKNNNEYKIVDIA